MDKVRMLFAGTSEFAIPILKKLIEQEYIDLVGVITQPDKPVGRKQEVTASAVKLSIVNCQLPIVIYQPEVLRNEAQNILEATKPDLIIVASYGQFIPKVMLDYPKYKCLNIHASILPDLRGAVPIPMAILKGYESTGVSIQIMEEGMDTGSVIGKSKQEIVNSDTTKTLTGNLSDSAAELIEEILPRWIRGEIEPVIQNDSEATYCYQKDISKENAEIDWNKNSIEIDRMIRAFYPWPIAWFTLTEMNTPNTNLLGKKIKIYKAEIKTDIVETEERNAGNIFKYEKKLCIKTGDGILEIKELQLEGKNRMSGKEYLFLV